MGRDVGLRWMAAGTLVWCVLGSSAACDGEGDEDLGGLRVALDMVSEGQGTDSWPGEDGQPVMLTEGALVVGSVELLRCDGAQAPTKRRAVGVAWAHSGSSPLKVGTPVVLDLLAGASHNGVGTFEPPPGRYCSARVEAAPADADALGLSAHPHVEGATLKVSLSRNAGTQALTSTRRLAVTVALRSADGALAPLVLGSALDNASVRVVLPPLGQLSPAVFASGDALLDAMLAQVVVNVERP